MPSFKDEKESFAEEQVHFTYKKDPDLSSLCQGDLLKVTDALKDVLEEVHPYFLHEQYKYFMVLTQSCDLVWRGESGCKTPYITLAAVKSFDQFFEKRLLADKLAEDVNGYLLVDSKKRERAYQLLERLYNNTESDYFFLYRDETIHLPDSMVVFLKVSIALKSRIHYGQCLAAKVLELSDEFKAKLGWLVGNMYSRVGTRDWESVMTSQQRTNMLNDELRTHCLIASKEQIKALKEEFGENQTWLDSQERVMEFLSNCHIPSRYDRAMEIIGEIIAASGKKIPDEEKERLFNSIKSRRALKVLLSG